ncbi:MAG: hypothetical protein ACOC7Y_01040 [Chloroflexota bacterium]
MKTLLARFSPVQKAVIVLYGLGVILTLFAPTSHAHDRYDQGVTVGDEFVTTVKLYTEEGKPISDQVVWVRSTYEEDLEPKRITDRWGVDPVEWSTTVSPAPPPDQLSPGDSVTVEAAVDYSYGFTTEDGESTGRPKSVSISIEVLGEAEEQTWSLVPNRCRTPPETGSPMPESGTLSLRATGRVDPEDVHREVLSIKVVVYVSEYCWEREADGSSGYSAYYRRPSTSAPIDSDAPPDYDAPTPLTTQGRARTPGPGKIITIIFSGLPAISTIIPNLMGGKASAEAPITDGVPSEGPDEEPETRYVVQVSSQEVTVSPKEPASLALKAWKTVGGRPWAPAPEVDIGLDFQPPVPGLEVSPERGSGEMQADISVDEDVLAGVRTLVVTGIAPEARTSAQVQVEVETSPYRLKTSSDRFEILVGETVKLEVKAQRRSEEGLWEDEPDARIRPWLPTERDYFEWSPPPPYSKGANELYGQVTMRITAVDAEKESELCYLDFTAIFPDQEEVDKRVEIILKEVEYELEFL